MSNYSHRLAELRKENGMSQKDAAQGLGVSQALLSHYEKGIREFGLSFLSKAAQYYGVTSDYLLGMSDDKSGSAMATNISNDDGVLSSATIYRSMAQLRESGKTVSAGFSERMRLYYLLSIYRGILSGVNSGELPIDWIADKRVLTDRIYLRTVELMLDELTYSSEVYHNPTKDSELPLCIETVIKAAEEAVFKRIQSLSAITAAPTE